MLWLGRPVMIHHLGPPSLGTLQLDPEQRQILFSDKQGAVAVG